MLENSRILFASSSKNLNLQKTFQGITGSIFDLSGIRAVLAIILVVFVGLLLFALLVAIIFGLCKILRKPIYGNLFGILIAIGVLILFFTPAKISTLILDSEGLFIKSKYFLLTLLYLPLFHIIWGGFTFFHMGLMEEVVTTKSVYLIAGTIVSKIESNFSQLVIAKIFGPAIAFGFINIILYIILNKSGYIYIGLINVAFASLYNIFIFIKLLGSKYFINIL